MTEMLLATTGITLLLIVLPFKISFVTKDFLLVFWLLTSAVLLLSRLAGYQLLIYARSRGRNLRNLVVVAEARDANVLARRIEREVTLGYRVVRIITPREAE
jgi:FlaA1/EpsC-like NDP-sugar epimerase